MSKNVVEIIKEAEEKATQIIANANDEARDILRKAEDDSLKFHDSKLASAREKAKAMIVNAEELADKKANELMAENVQESDKLKANALKNKDIAVDFIIDSVISN